jgi:gamma-tubulin complex component 2
MTTMSAFVSYQSAFNTALAKFLADPEGESAAAKADQRWTVLSKFEINFNHHTKVGSPHCSELSTGFNER